MKKLISYNIKTLQTCSEMFIQTHFSVHVLYLKEFHDPYESPEDEFARLAREFLIYHGQILAILENRAPRFLHMWLFSGRCVLLYIT